MTRSSPRTAMVRGGSTWCRRTVATSLTRSSPAPPLALPGLRGICPMRSMEVSSASTSTSMSVLALRSRPAAALVSAPAMTRLTSAAVSPALASAKGSTVTRTSSSTSPKVLASLLPGRLARLISRRWARRDSSDSCGSPSPCQRSATVRVAATGMFSSSSGVLLLAGRMVWASASLSRISDQIVSTSDCTMASYSSMLISE